MAGAAGYGVSSPSYGYYKPPQVSRIGTGNRSLALAAAKPTTQQDPFGLMTDTTNSAQVARQNATPPASGKTVIPSSSAPSAGYGLTKGTFDIATGAQGQLVPPRQGVWPGLTASAATSPVVPPAYDVNLDPTVQSIGSLTGRSDAEAQAAALKAKSDLALNYGDENLARTLGGDTLAQAAAQNPTSTLAQLAQARSRNERTMTEDYNKSNLLYSGARVLGEQQGAQDYQNQLAQAAANVGGALGGIDSNLTSALGQSLGQRIQAMIAAGQAHATDPGAATDTGASTDTGAGTDPAGGTGQTDAGNRSGNPFGPNAFGNTDPAIALAIAAAQKRPAVGSGGGRMLAV